MRYKQEETMHGVYQCPCGYFKTYKYKDYETNGNPYGDVFISICQYNLGDAYCYCPKCKQYWYDGNAVEWNKLSGIKKFFYIIGFWFLPLILPPWIAFSYIKAKGPSQPLLRTLLYFLALIFFMPLTILYDLFLIALMLFFNIPFVPFVLIYHLSEIRASKRRIKYGSPNKQKYYQQMDKTSDYSYDFWRSL